MNKINYDDLNKEQKEAVFKLQGPVMCIAGAGTGKTRVLTYRVARLVESGVLLNRIVGLTFTNKAANEMKDRINNLLGIETSGMYISTFHSFCLRLLREEIPIEYLKAKGYREFFTIIDEEDSQKAMKKILEQEHIEINEYNSPKVMLEFVSNLKNKQHFMFDNMNQKKNFINIFPKYQAYLKKQNVMDFDDILLNFLNMLSIPEIRQKLQNKFDYFLVDEFQDTNVIQYEILKGLVNSNQNVFIVGDQDQSIYSFRGANIKNIDDFMKDYPTYSLIKLERNYRSTPEILNLANITINQNHDRIKKVLYTDLPNKKEFPILCEVESDKKEIEFIFKEILRLTGRGVKYGDITILYRANYLSRNFEAIFKRYRIPYKIYGGISYFARKEVKDFLAYLRLAINKDDDLAFERIINVPARKITKTTVDKVYVESIRHSCSMYEALNFITASDVTKACYQSINDFRRLITDIKDFISNDQNDTKEIINIIYDRTNYQSLLNDKSEESKNKILNIFELKNVIEESLKTYDGPVLTKLAKMLETSTLSTDLDGLKDDDNVVKLMTYHTAKGLEFPYVFMMATEDGVFPSNMTLNNHDLNAMEEERRVFYVGVTRAKKKLYITHAKRRMMFGKMSFNKPSVFVRYVPDNVIDKVTIDGDD